jgi:DNA mismatch endonuclease (patch repair protein)
MPGKPDLVLPKYNTVIFVHGCFWHVHEGCDKFSIPQTRTEWWREKLYRNKERDQENIKKLEEMDWNVIVIWECETKNSDKLLSLIESII